ncbi:hypothetical protein BRADI_2g45895v3 [Brachypodium distachyon]|uniref:Uncharacterized protein n=1 Tax=Brachypodium distachyon TaxID=15368 RepID=A0A2K2DE54_BRADI|nr:hypothetical protein BRADI_2g45895v3 [Brachypodium distachyon]PNT72542.1 hypothetical protein BRADI_2g45895v3 [Brachypodium distachyon]
MRYEDLFQLFFCLMANPCNRPSFCFGTINTNGFINETGSDAHFALKKRVFARCSLVPADELGVRGPRGSPTIGPKA